MESGIVITNIPPYDGEYEFDFDIALSTREWRWIKQISNYMPLTLDQGLEGGDPDVICAFAVIALVRNRKITPEQALDAAERIADVPFEGSRIQFITPEAEDDADPPALTSEPEGSSPNGSLENGNSQTPKGDSSGSTSPSDSEKSAETPEGTGATR